MYFLAADCALQEKEYPEYETFLAIDTKKGIVYDGDRDDDFALLNFEDVNDYTDLQNGVVIEWNYCTIGRARQITEYMRTALGDCEVVQLWKVWLMDYYEYDERPRYKTREITLTELRAEDIQEISEADVWGDDKVRPTDYCLSVRRQIPVCRIDGTICLSFCANTLLYRLPFIWDRELK